MITIRYAASTDLDYITAIEAACFPSAEAAGSDSFKDRLFYYPDHFWLLLENEKIVSFVNGMVTDKPDLTDEMYENAAMHSELGRWQMIFGVDTIPSCRKKGYAGMLLQKAVQDAKDQNRSGLVLTCKNALIHYYESFGFINEGISQSVHGNVTWYQMRLSF
ncbi:MAG: GNAT family N-acetyltransferase [Butyrivibrio sp.]|nr:GNAT family N-acetyltransferase [Butyrivibrio sp.]